MNLTAEGLRVIVHDSRRLSLADARNMLEAAEELDELQTLLDATQRNKNELEQRCKALEDKLRELTRPPVKMPDRYGHVWVHKILFRPELPSWARF